MRPLRLCQFVETADEELVDRPDLAEGQSKSDEQLHVRLEATNLVHPVRDRIHRSLYHLLVEAELDEDRRMLVKSKSIFELLAEFQRDSRRVSGRERPELVIVGKHVRQLGVVEVHLGFVFIDRGEV